MTTRKISASMFLESLSEQCLDASRALESYRKEIALRDDLIRDALAAGISYKALMTRTRLSRDRLYTISVSPYSEYHRSV